MGRWNEDEGWNGDVLWRMVALLFALAGLADAAARLPAHRRHEVLGFLMRGEAEARSLVVEMATGQPVAGDGPAFLHDASYLAAHLRVLAFVLWFMALRGQSTRRDSAGEPKPPRAKRAKLFAMSSHTCSRSPRSKLPQGGGARGPPVPLVDGADLGVSWRPAVRGG